MAILFAALGLGFFGSFHCIGMCGPIALSLPVQQLQPAKKTLLILLYNFGRMVTYAVLGATVGGLGQGIAIAGYQQTLSIFLGSAILIALIFPKLFSSKGKLGHLVNPVFFKIQHLLAKLLKRNRQSSLFVIGLLNGVLPCGLVYMGLAAAAATGSVIDGAWFMFLFGAGTIPVMLALPLAGALITVDTRNKIRKTLPVIIGLTAVLLIVRGLELGIPYLSPGAAKNNTELNCHNLSEDAQHNAILCTGQNSAHNK